MLARSRKTKDCDGAIDPRAIDLLEAMAMDPAAEHIYKVGHIQQRRRRAVQYIPARASTLAGRECGTDIADACTVHTADTQPDCSPQTASTDSAPSTAPVDDSAARLTHAHEGADTSDEELYLRRVSVLYHELWSGEWVEHQSFGLGCLDALHSRSGAEAERGGEIESEPEPEVTACSSCQTDGTCALNSTNDVVLELEPSILTADAATTETKITTATTLQTIPDTIAHADNGCADSNGHVGGSDRCFPELQNSWVSLADAYIDTDRPVTATATTRDRTGPVANFSPSDLVDALVGTVRRLEDDHTLLRHKRWSVVKELAITEAHYLRDLLVLRAVFYEPLSEPANSAPLRTDDAQTIFGNLDQVIDCARSLVEYLTVAAVYEANRCYALDDEESRDACGYGIGSNGPSETTETPTLTPDTVKEHSGPVQLRRRCTNRPASQPEAVRIANSSDPALRNSAWADISIAQAFLLTSQRMERVYAQYCQNFEAASRRIIELKRLTATVAVGVAASATAPTTPMTAQHPQASDLPFADHLRGWRQPPAGYSSPAHSSMAGFGNSFADISAEGTQMVESDPEVRYAAAIQQLITEQAQLLAGKTTSWDLPSLLIKPVQRILKYPLLIRNLLGLTRTHTLDRNRLEKAAQSVERIAETINAVNSTNGLRISTATATPSLSASGYDTQGRITRELRRVLRRKPGNANHVRTKSHTESSVKDRLRMSVKHKHRMRESHERLWHAGAATTPASGTEALIEQHETRIAELIRALRRWENDLGTMLGHQSALAARWRDLYAPVGSNPEPVMSYEYKACTPSLLSSARRSGGVFFADEVGGRGSTDLSRCFQQQWQLVPDLSLPEPGQGNGSKTNSISHGDFKPDDEPAGAEATWEARRRERAVQHYTALDVIHTRIYPNVVCTPLRTQIYPVLNSLMQVYSDGPRYILSEIARATSLSSLTAASAAEPDTDRLAKLQRALAEDLPKLFEHERTVVRLLLEQVASIQQRFYAQTVEHLSGSGAKPSNAAPPVPAELDDRSDAESAPLRPRADRPSTSGRMLDRARTSRHNPSRASVPSSSRLIKATFDKRLIERASPSPGTILPSASECTSQIRSGLWLLAQEAQRHSPTEAVVKSRHRQSTIERADGSDTVSDTSISFDDYSSVSVFELATGTDAEPPGAAGARSAVSIPVQVRSGDIAVYSEAADQHGLGAQLLASRPTQSKHMRKKSSGFIERIANFKPGKIIRGHPSNTLAHNRVLDGSSMDNVKPRPQLGLAIGVSDDNLPPVPPVAHVRSNSRSTLRAKSDADLRRTASGWSEEAARFEPLPTVDPIRFSKGFIEATFQLLGSQEPPADGQPPQDSPAATSAKSNYE
ncbi:hypothetical protein H4S01_002956 [Coemansia sp. RSA 2610]|nr:hypothetical protein H4S01_002956 [Coemansia sp. RSA 2610]